MMNSNTKNPVQTFRDGAVGLSVWCRQTRDGRSFYDFSISRSYVKKDDETGLETAGYSSTFTERHEEQLKSVIGQACQFIREAEETDQPASNNAAA